jgi:hypothetical protein
MNNRYRYDNRRRTYGNRNTEPNNGLSSIVFLVFVLFAMAIWVVTLKSDISRMSTEKIKLKSENVDLKEQINILSKRQKEIEKINVVEEVKPKKVFRRPIKDTTKAKVDIIEIKETKVIAIDTTKTTN